jgi:hypothetical protein
MPSPGDAARRSALADDRSAPATGGAPGDTGPSPRFTTGILGPAGPWARRFIAAFLVAWCAALVGPPLALLGWRESRLAELADPAAQADWDAFRDDMRRQSGRDGPVQRKVPRSAEPPERVWLRDYVGLAITAWVTLVGVLGGFLGLALRGLLAVPPPVPGERPAGNGGSVSGRE